MLNSSYHRSELKVKGIKRYKLIGIISEIILSKDYFKKNEEIKIFVKNIIGLDFKEYLFKSRTMLVATFTRIVYSANEKEMEMIRRNLLHFMESMTEFNKDGNKQKTNLSKWIKGISNE